MPDARCANNFPVFQDQHNLSAGVAEPTEVSLQVLQELKPCHLAAPSGTADTVPDTKPPRNHFC